MNRPPGIVPVCWGLATLVSSGVALFGQQGPTAPSAPQLKLSETVIGQLAPGSKLEMARSSADHIAWAEKKGGSFVVRLDGTQVGGVYDGVEFLRFSADGQHLAFTAKRNSTWVLVIDGQERSKPYGRLTAPALSANGASYAVSACVGKQCRLVVNGEENEPTFEDISAPSFTVDGEHHGYFGKRGKVWILQLDGKAHGPEMDDFAGWRAWPDGRRVAVAALIKGDWTWVVDGMPGPGFDVISDVAFSPDFQHYAYGGTKASPGLAKDKTRGAMVEDGKVIGAYEGRGFGLGLLGALGGSPSNITTGVRLDLIPDFHGVSTPQYAPDGRLVYVARRADNNVTVIIGGTPGPTFEDVVSPVGISKDGGHVAYVAKRGDLFVEVRDHQPGASFPGKRHESHVGLLVISPGGDHVAFETVLCGPYASGLARGRCLRRLVVDGQAGAEYDAYAITNLTMTPDGKAYCYMVVGAEGTRDRVVFNGLATKLYDTVFRGSVELIDEKTIEFTAQDGPRFVKVTAVLSDPARGT